MTKFNVGDKVVPISKTVDWNTLNRVKDHLNESGTWNRALSNEQTFLYVNRIDKFRNLYICSNECGGGGDYFHESDLTPYKTKPTKKQRITALEYEVAELKLIVHELRERPQLTTVINNAPQGPSTTNTVEGYVPKLLNAQEDLNGVIEFEGQQYRKVDRVAREGDVVIITNEAEETCEIQKNKPYKVDEHNQIAGSTRPYRYKVYRGRYNRTPETVDVYELIVEGKKKIKGLMIEIDAPKSANQQRAEVIEKAKKFVEENIKQLASHDFVISEGLVKLCYRKVYREWKIAVAKCNPSDVFNEHIGKAIALGRALGLDVSEFEQAVQPTEQEVGQILTFPKGDSWHKRHNYRIDGPTVDCGNLTVVYNEVDQLDHRVGKKSYGPLTKGVIIEDTNAKYEVES